MALLTYVQALAIQYPGVLFQAVGLGDVYTDLTYVGGDAMPTKAAMDTFIASYVTPTPYVPPQIQQMVSGTFGASSTNAVIPFDNTIPQSTEGTQVLSVNFTPRYAGSSIVIRIQMFVSHSATDQRFITGAIFNGTNCIKSTILGSVVSVAGLLAVINGNQAGDAGVEAVDKPNTTSQITYSLRVGSDNSSGTLSINQGTSGQTFSTVGQGTYTITEIL